MKNLQNPSFHYQKNSKTKEGTLSKLFLGFLERKISAQTIADILRAQILESNVAVEDFEPEACCKIIESLTHANTSENCCDLIFYFAKHPLFPLCLSYQASTGALKALLIDILKRVSCGQKPFVQQSNVVLESLSRQWICLALESTTSDHQKDLSELSLLIEKINPIYFLDLKFKPFFQIMLLLIVFKKTFSTSEKATKDKINPYESALKNQSFLFESDLVFLKNMVLMLQKELNFLFQGCLNNQTTETVENALLARDSSKIIFNFLINAHKKDKSFNLKSVANWAMEIKHTSEQAQFFTRTDWHWMQTLSEQVWNDGLREPPYWVLKQAADYCALIFHCAPAQWLQRYGHQILHPIYQCSMENGFVAKQEHFQYVEFLLRHLRKKSPFVASHVQSLHALSLLTHLTPHESVQYETVRMRLESPVSSFFKNPVSGALQLMMEILSPHDVLKEGKKE